MSADIRPADLGIKYSLEAVINEVEYQVLLWGFQSHPSGASKEEFERLAAAAKLAADFAAGAGTLTWYEILREEFYEAFAEDDNALIVDELIQVCAVCLSIIRDLEKTDGVQYAKQLPNRAEQHREVVRQKTLRALRNRAQVEAGNNNKSADVTQL